MWQLLAIALLVSACGGTVQPSAATAGPSPSPDVVLSTPSPSAPAAPDSGYLSGVDAGMLTEESEARGLSCSDLGGFSGNEPTKQAWSCDGAAADGSDLIVGAQGPASNRIEMATAEVLTYGTVKVKTITDFLGGNEQLVRRGGWGASADLGAGRSPGCTT